MSRQPSASPRRLQRALTRWHNDLSYRKQFLCLLGVQIVVVGLALTIARLFWGQLCATSWASCLGATQDQPTFLLLSTLRPLVFTPVWVTGFIAGDSFGLIEGTALTAVGACLSAFVLYLPTRWLAERFMLGWIRTNLPATHAILRDQDLKLILVLRLIPLIPFDLTSIIAGALSLRRGSLVVGTLLGSLPTAFVATALIKPAPERLASTVELIVGFLFVLGVPLLIRELASRRRGDSLIRQLKRMYLELSYEAKASNEVVTDTPLDPNKPTVLLLYGFFSSRRSLTNLSRSLHSAGYQTLSFNFGGALGVFNTRCILHCAAILNDRLTKIRARTGIGEVTIIAHSKGGLIASWWLTRVKGDKRCPLVITMGTPFQGSLLTYPALATPLGLLWRDIWQMRPGSELLRSLRRAPLPETTRMVCLTSRKDVISRGRRAWLASIPPNPRIESIELNDVDHFEFFRRRDVSERLVEILNETGAPAPALTSPGADNSRG